MVKISTNVMSRKFRTKFAVVPENLQASIPSKQDEISKERGSPGANKMVNTTSTSRGRHISKKLESASIPTTSLKSINQSSNHISTIAQLYGMPLALNLQINCRGSKTELQE